MSSWGEATSGTAARDGSGFVLVGDDGSWHSRVAVDFAADEAASMRLPLRVLRVLSDDNDPDLSHAAQLRERRAAAEAAGSSLRETVVRAGTRRPGLVVDGFVLEDPDAALSAWQSAGCRLAVVGSRSKHGSAAFALGSVSWRLVHAVRAPIVVVPDEASPVEVPKVVAGIDDRALGRHVLRRAADEAARRDCPLEVVHCYRVGSHRTEGAALAAQRVWQEQVRSAGFDTRVPVTQVISTELPAEALSRHAMGASLLVIGSRGRLALGRLTRYSVSREVLDAMPCPVMVVTADAIPETRVSAAPASSATQSPR